MDVYESRSIYCFACQFFFARWPETDQIIISNLTLALLRSGRPKWPPLEHYLQLSLVAWVQFSVANYLLFDKKDEHRETFLELSPLSKKKTANFNVSTRISRFPAIFRLVTTSKSAFVSPNFTLSTCDVLGIRHRLNSSSCTRANLVGDLRQCRGTFLTDGHAVRMCLWELDSVRMWNSRAIVISAEIGLLLSICEAETAIIRHGSNYGRRHFEFLH